MALQDCIKFANENPVCYIATADGDQPRVRAFLMFFANEDGFYFYTLAPKSVSKQLKDNPRVEVCFYDNAELQISKMMRVTGKIEFLDDIALKTRGFEERRPLMEAVGIQKPEDPMIEIFRIYTGEAHFWTLADNMKESEIERIKF